MIVAFFNEKRFRNAIQAAASPEEDVIFGKEEGHHAVYHGFPRLVVFGDRLDHPFRVSGRMPDVPILRLGIPERSPGSVRRWAPARRGPEEALDGPVARLRKVLSEAAGPGSWVDAVFRDMTSASGAPLPPAFRGFCRRVLEYPARYHDLHAMADLTGLSRGALKARFRRRGLRSPSDHIRWLRVIAAAHVLADERSTTVQVAYRLGFTSNGNLCRAVQGIAEVNPADFREQAARSGLLVRFVERFLLDGKTVGRWKRFEPMFFPARAA